jgi:hypothetical protein
MIDGSKSSIVDRQKPERVYDLMRVAERSSPVRYDRRSGTVQSDDAEPNDQQQDACRPDAYANDCFSTRFVRSPLLDDIAGAAAHITR